MKLIQLTVLILLMSMPACCRAQTPATRFRNINAGNGLSNNETNTIFKDSEGYVWIGTASGLNRYDGNEIRVFRNNPADTTSLPDNYVEEISEDALGRLWLQTSGNYSIYDPVTERFTPFMQSSAWGITGTPNVIRPAGSDLWIATGGVGLFKKDLRNPDAKARKMLQLSDSSENFTDVKPVPQQNLTIAVSDNGRLYVIGYDNGKLIRSSRLPASRTVKSSYSLMLDSSGKVWIYGFDGTHIYDISTGTWSEAPVNAAKCPVLALEQDAKGNIWIGYDKDGIEIIGTDGRITPITNSPVDFQSLAGNSIRAFYCDRMSDGMWVGTYKKGVSVHYANEFGLNTRHIADINCVCPVRGEPQWLWLGSDHEGLLKYNVTTGETIRIPSDKNNAIVCLEYDSTGTLWFGTYGGGLNRLKNGVISNFGMADGLASTSVWSILANNDGTLWLGTLGGGVQLFNPAGRSIETFDTSNSGLINNYIISLARSSDGRIFIGNAYGVCVLSPATRKISAVPLSGLGGRKQNTSAVNQLRFDSRGLLWIASRAGLQCLDTRTDSIYSVPLGERATDIILGVIEAPDRTMWASSDGALFNINVDRNDNNSFFFSSKVYDNRDGVSSEGFNQRSFCLLPSGQVVAGTQNGIAIIEPSDISKKQSAGILFTSLAINNRPVAVGEKLNGYEVLPMALNRIGTLRLKPDHKSFTVSFSTDTYAGLSRIYFRYRLKGLGDEWIECGPGGHTASFSNLSPGKYILEVEAVGDDCVSVVGRRSLPIVVSSPWWATWWANAIYAVLIAGACTLALLYVKHREHRKFIERRREDAQRKTEELNQLKFKFFTNISHELRTPLTLILSPVESMLEEKNDERDVRRLSTVRNNANRLLYLVNQLLDFRKNEMSELRLHFSEGDLVATVQNACRSFIDMTERRNQHFNVVSDIPELNMEYDNDKVTKIVLNLMSNAVKYTPEGGTIDVRLSRDGNNAVIEVADTGKGISPTDKEHIFERFYRSEDTSDLNTGTGIGLSMVYEYVRLHHGTVSVEDNPGGGTVFRVAIPTDLKAETGAEGTISGAAADAQESAVRKSEADINASDSQKGEASRPSVLFVDDNRDLVEFLRDEFSRDYDVCIASNGKEALELTKTHKFNLIVSDIMMPEIDGIQLCRSLKSRPATVNIPLILLSAKQDVGSVIEGLTLGADDYVTKPFNKEVLHLRMKHLLELGRNGLRHSLIEPSPKEIKITTVDEQLVAKAVEYVERNMDNPDLTVEEMASALGMSRVHLYKRLSAITGRTPIEFIRVLRLKRATQYLRDDRLTIAEIAYKVGFNNPKYFSRHFRDEYGISPAKYQEKESSDKNLNPTD